MRFFDDLQGNFVRKHHDEIDGFQGRQHGRTVAFGVDGPVIPFAEHLDGGVAVDGDEEALT